MDLQTIQHQLAASVPVRFRPYMEARGGLGQLTQFMAVVAGIKPVLDDWVPVERVEGFQALAADLGLVSAVDSYFEFIDEASTTSGIVGRERFNTTRARGHSPRRPVAGSSAHIFLARDTEWLRRGVASGWYMLVVDGRIVEKPWIDHYRFGECLGYPDCCRQFFALHNNWHSDNSYWQALSATRGSPLFLCNSLVKNSGLSYAVHLPCRFDCSSTSYYAAQVRAFVQDESPVLSRGIDGLLQRPFLMLSEWELFGFDGERTGPTHLNYRDVFMVPTNRPDRGLLAALKMGDRIDVDLDLVRISRGTRTILTYAARSDRFGPQMPCLIDFAELERG